MLCSVVCRRCCTGDPSHKKDSAWAWIVCFAAATNLAFSSGLVYSFGVLLPVFMNYFKESRETTAWIGSISLALCLFFGAFASSLINWLGCRAVAVTGCLTCSLSLAIASFAKNLIILYLTFGLLGIGASCVFVSSLGIVPRCFDKRKSIAIGIASTGQGLGTMILSQVLQSLVNALSWRNALRTVAGALVINGLLGLLYNPMIEPVSSGELLTSEEDGQRRTPKRFTFHFSVWKLPRFLVLAVTGLCFQLSRSTMYVHLVKYSEDRGMSSDASARLILFLGINVVLGRFTGGFLCSIKRLENLYILQSVLLINGVSTILLTLAQKYEALVAYSVVFGFGDGVMASVFNILILTCVDPSRAASSFGYFLLIVSVTSLAGPPIAGLTADKLGSYGPAFYMAGGAYAAAALTPSILYCVKNKEEKKKELLPSNKEIADDAQEFEERSSHEELCADGPSRTTHNHSKPVALDHELFVSTV